MEKMSIKYRVGLLKLNGAKITKNYENENIDDFIDSAAKTREFRIQITTFLSLDFIPFWNFELNVPF